MRNTHPIQHHIATHRADLTGLADRVWGTPETLYQETASCAEHTAMLKAKGFRVTEGLGGIPTAVMGEAGEGGPVIAILGEYDALPGLSQVAGIAEQRELEPGGNGHGCGHNLLGAAALLAACALKDWLEETGTPGRVRYYGCPAEEGGAAKTFLVREGAFRDVDAAITWHPNDMTRVDDPESLANTRIDFTFTGRSSHAAMSPHLGRSALDAVELMSVGVNYLREHMVQDARIHYAYLDAGGRAPNVVQARAVVRYSIRALTSANMRALVDRVRDVARGAALMTGTQVEGKVFSAVSENLVNEVMDRTMHGVLEEIGGVPFDDADRAYARAIQATLSPEDIATPWRVIRERPRADTPLCDWVVKLRPGGEVLVGSTDVADVTWAVPTTEVLVSTLAIGTPGHSWQVTAQGKSAGAHKGMVHAGLAMARCGQRLIEDPALLAEAKAEHAARLAETPYVCPIPADVRPPV
ncbi:MAG: amidohydrolase [Rhodobacter sp.]|uniref:amidohydrolase n=1 Tax=Pararhodobacter sp. TaxID=2127056 RepID=UPI001DF7ECDF|nr:amidohydrolase [Pararhodobacter sp.]MCB1346916.1 amidohydrolase [Paracoccaceae bacterium]MCC0074494.1 amidohydrolase [Rhodobacter sp.]HPD91861.1 amidohydrolase [Pararhodobacter sp.]